MPVIRYLDWIVSVFVVDPVFIVAGSDPCQRISSRWE
jgi:hypothetical protein